MLIPGVLEHLLHIRILKKGLQQIISSCNNLKLLLDKVVLNCKIRCIFERFSKVFVLYWIKLLQIDTFWAVLNIIKPYQVDHDYILSQHIHV